MACTVGGATTLQWRRAGVNLSDNGRITGSATSTLTINSVSAGDAGSYDCVASNACGTTISNSASLTAGCAQWTRVALSGPSPRYAQAAYDSVRNVAVLFGGYNAGALYGDTWEWNGTAWTQRAVAGPGPRTEFGIGFDSARGVTVVFSGDQVGTNNGDTWEWNGSAWTQRPIAGPSGRYDAAMAYDSTRHVMVLYGGVDGPSGATLSDLWEYDGTVWVQRSFTGAGPGPRTYHGMVYDSRRQVSVLFGGSAHTNGLPMLNDTWEWNGTAWTQRQPAGTPPQACLRPGMTYDSARAATVLFGGVTDQSGIGIAGTWEWDGTAWTRRNVNEPPDRYLHAIWFNTASSTTTIFGGTLAGTGGVNTNDTWAIATDLMILAQPAPGSACAGGQGNFSVSASGVAPLAYQWQLQTAPGAWSNLSTSNITLSCGGAAHASSPSASTTSISVTPCQAMNHYQVRCVVSSSCSSVPSNPASLTINSADFNGDGDLGTDADIEAFFACIAGNCCPACASADFNADGDLGTDADIEAFFRVLAGGSC